jgi:prephenate dehydratase
MVSAPRPARYAFLGPEGTFAEQALQGLPAARGAHLLPEPSVPAALDAVRGGEADGAMVPLENSVEGAVAVTLDELATGEPLVVTREALLPVTFDLLARAGTALSGVTTVLTHPHAAAQCRRWLSEHLPGADVRPALSTAAAARAVAEDRAADAAIAAPIAAARYRLAVLAEGIGDTADAVTRFVLVSRPAPPARPTGTDKTSLVAYIADDHPGALLEILTELAVRGVNLTRIESRPTGVGLGRYCFSIDAEGHVAEARVGEALMGLRRVCSDVRFLGSYPRADGAGSPVRRGTADADFAAAAAWLAAVRAGRAD